MKLSELHVDNFKAAVGLKLDLSDMTALVGVNGSGKSTILEALDHFFRGTDIPQDSYRDPEKAVTISVKFIQIPRSKKPALITRTWRWVGEECVIDTKALGLKLSDPDNIINSVHMVFEHAEHETDDDGTDKSGLDLVKMIKSTISEEISKADLTALFAQSNDYYQNLGNSIAEFRDIMNQKLEGGADDPTGYAPGSTVDFRVRGPDPEPDIDTKLIEGGLDLSHKLAGHGTKRAYHMAALEAYAEMSSRRENGRLVLMLVDEPELHQHPQRLRRILQTYKKLADKPSVQIVYSTHSPELVDLEAPGGIYRISRDPERNIVANSGSDLDEDMSHWSTSKSLAEGIFSTGVILVEGARDEAVLGAAFSAVDIGGKSAMKCLIENNIHIIHTTGVSHMPDFVQFFRTLGVPLFAIWDADMKGSGAKDNKAVLDALGNGIQFDAQANGLAFPPAPDHLCFANDAGTYFKDHLGFEGAPDTAETKAKIKRAISDAENMVPRFKTDKFFASEFATSIVPHIYNFFPKPA